MKREARNKEQEARNDGMTEGRERRREGGRKGGREKIGRKQRTPKGNGRTILQTREREREREKRVKREEKAGGEIPEDSGVLLLLTRSSCYMNVGLFSSRPGE